MLNYQRVIYYDQMDAHASTDTKSQQDAGVLRHYQRSQNQPPPQNGRARAQVNNPLVMTHIAIENGHL